MEDLGPTDMILRMKISRTPNGISLSLAHNIERIPHKFDFYNTKLISKLYNSSIALKNYGCACISTEILSIDRVTTIHIQQD